VASGAPSRRLSGAGPGQHRRLLLDVPDPLPQALARDLPDVHTVDPEHATGRVVEPLDQGQRRGLAGTGRTDQCGTQAAFHGEADLVQDRRPGLVTEADPNEFDGRCPGRRRGYGGRRTRTGLLVGILGREFEHLGHPVEGGHPGLDGGVGLEGLGEREDKGEQVQQKRDELPSVIASVATR